MKTGLFMTMVAATLILAGCRNDENEEMNNWNGEIRLSSGVTVQTRADTPTPPDTQIADGQQVGVFISDATAGTSIGANLKYDANGSGGLTLATTAPTQAQPYYPATGNDVSIYAYHPYDANATTAGSNTYEFSVTADQSHNSTDNNDKGYYNSDLLYSEAKTYTRKADAQSLGFKHLLAKVVCTLTSGKGSPTIDGATVSIVNAQLKGDFKPSDGSFTTKTTAGATSDVTMNSSITSGSYIAVIPPQAFAKDAKFLKVKLSTTAGGGEFYYKIPNGSSDAALELQASHVYKYNITVDLSGLTVSSSIEDWEGVNDQFKDGNAVME